MPQKPPYAENFKTAKTKTKYFQVRKTQKRIEPGIRAVEVAVIVVDPTMGHVLLIGLPLETAPRRAALKISSHSLKRWIPTRELCKTSRSTTTWWTASRWTSSTRRTSSRWTSCSSRGTSFARITKSREQQHLSRTCSSSHNRCTVSQAGVQRGALVGHRQRPVWV